MTAHEAKNPWFRRGLLAIALILALLGLALAPGLLQGQEVQQKGLKPLPAGAVDDSFTVSADTVLHINGSPYAVNLASYIGTGEDTGSYEVQFNGYVTSKAENTRICYYAPLYLPDGASVTSLVMDYVDNTPYQFELYLLKKAYSPGAPQKVIEMARIWTEPSGGPMSPEVQRDVDASINSPAVDNDSYQYFIEACPWHPLHRIYGVSVYYTR